MLVEGVVATFDAGQAGRPPPLRELSRHAFGAVAMTNHGIIGAAYPERTDMVDST
ncbi:hypothetical protein [Rhodanobacter lindaniclasticus]